MRGVGSSLTVCLALEQCFILNKSQTIIRKVQTIARVEQRLLVHSAVNGVWAGGPCGQPMMMDVGISQPLYRHDQT
jgi:hypothetical protein